MAENSQKPEYFIGVDLGGTKILSAIFTSGMKCIAKSKVSTKASRGPDVVIDRVARCVTDAIDEADLNPTQIKAIGIGAPGAVNSDEGKVIFAPNLGWENVALKRILEKELQVPVYLENDCNLCTLGVYHVELAAKPKFVLGLFLGTGIGGGIILDGKIYSGFNRTAGEVGHMVIEVGGPKCGCGNRGCFEALAGRAAMFKRIQSDVRNGQKTILTEILGDDLEDMRSGDLRKAIRRGDKYLERVVEEAAEYTGIAIANLINVLNPEVVVVGGGVIDALEDEMMAIIVETAMDNSMPGTTKGIDIIPSKLGDLAGVTGGAVLAKQSSKS